MKLDDNLNCSRYDWAASIINTAQDTKANVFDIGARDGVMKHLIHNKNILYEGFDLEPLATSITRWNLEEENKSLENKADYILFLEIVEHLRNPWSCLSNLNKVMKVGGKLILTTPNPHWSNARFTFFTNNFLQCFSQSDLDLNHHIFTPWPHVVEKLLTDNGFLIETYVTLERKTKIFDKKVFENPLRIFKRIIMVLLESVSKNSCGMSYGIVAKKI